MRILALLVDDEAPARDELAYLLSQHDDVTVLQADSAAHALEIIAKEKPDLVFQDIQMPGKDGFHVLSETIARAGDMGLDAPPLFVFVTAFDQYAVRAFEENAVDYLLKPVSEKRLAKSLDRVRELLGADDGMSNEHQALQKLLANMGGQPKFDRIPLDRDGRISLVDVDKIVLFATEEKKVSALTDEGLFPCHGLSTMGAAEERLAGKPFFRANRSVLINLARIAEFSPWYGGRYSVVMNDPERTEITVSRNQVKSFKDALGI